MNQVIVGAGTVGSATALLLAEQGHRVRLVSRHGRGAEHDGIERVVADATDTAALARLCRGAVALYNCANPSSYARWAAEWPPMAASMLSAAEHSDAVLVTMSNLYGYGPVDRPMREDTSPAGPGKKGRIRAIMWQDALAAHRAGRVRVTEARASDYFGPGFTDTAHLADRVVPRVLNGRTVRVLGDPDVAHTWTYIDDVARALVVLGTDERAWGRAWHVPSGPARSQRQMVEAFAHAAAVPTPRVVGTPTWALRALGFLSPTVRELDEIRYQFERPFVMESTAFTDNFGVPPTPLDRSALATVRWWRGRDHSRVRESVAA
jgi:nucleoside-diphosphate-sugar epimerase